jgi:hypothetical protein
MGTVAALILAVNVGVVIGMALGTMLSGPR